VTGPTERLTAALAGRYRVLRRIGEGGMALVYLAEDVKHHRQVALKILRPELAQALGPERFLREIAIAARLTHPNILPLLDSGDAEGTLFFVMPYVEGESLRDRLVREGQLPVDEAVKLAQRVAAALGYAHGLGVVHRDIKPENILLAGGEPVVTDFGIAKAVGAAGETKLTESGFAVGTAAYMSPEQASGEAQVDGRSDVYAVGCVLYEMLAGAVPFVGPTLHAITARKLTEPVPPLRTVRETVPVGLEQIVFRALAKLPADRYGTAGQLAEALEAARSSAATPSAPVPSAATAMLVRPRVGAGWRNALPWGVAVGAVVVAAWAGRVAWQSQSSAMGMRLSVPTPPGTEIYGLSNPVILSPDGTTLVFAAGRNDSVRLYVRRLDSFATRPLPGTEGGDSPFFSPDGHWVGYFARKARQLRKVALAGGSPAVVAEDLSVGPVYGAWGPNDTIYFTNWPGQQISKVPARGGVVSDVTHGAPPGGWFRYVEQILPDGRHALAQVEGNGAYRLDIVSLETGEHRRLLEDAAGARLVGGRYLLFVPNGRPEIDAVRFDPDRLKVSGDPVTVLDSVATAPGWPLGYFGIAANGTLAYVPLVRWFSPDNSWPELALVGRDGKPERQRLPVGNGPRFSPDGRRIVHMGPGRHGPDIFSFDLDRGTDVRLTSHEGEGYEGWPIFSPDGRRVAYNRKWRRSEILVLYGARADGSGDTVRLTADTTMHQQPFAWTPGGAELLYTRGPSSETGMDIWVLPMRGGAERPFMRTAANETQPALSPDGRWLAWMTDASGRPEVMVRRYPDGPGVPVSREGGVEPVWGPGARELYFRDLSGRSVLAARFQPGDPPSAGAPQVLFSGGFQNCYIWCRAYDVSPDGRRFAMMKNFEGATDTGYWRSGSEIRIVPHWDRELAAKMQAAGTGGR
jgi:eukaryotic-like serine/threonine-protein kinase